VAAQWNAEELDVLLKARQREKQPAQLGTQMIARRDGELGEGVLLRGRQMRQQGLLERCQP
jgi:hypothetical protein